MNRLNKAAGSSLLAYTTVSMFSRTRVTAYACVLVARLMFVGGLTTPGSPVLGSLFQALLEPGLAWALGASFRGLSLRNQRLAELTTQLEGAQAQIAQRAVIEERVRIARELHDAAAHHISVIGVQAELAWYVFDSDPRQARESLGLRMVGTGMSNTDIAAELMLAEATVKTHIYRVMTKLDLASRAQAVVYAYETGLVTPGGRAA